MVFPKPELADEDGLLAVGGDLSIKRLLMAYHYGIFPWYNEDEPIYWHSPHQRCVIFPERFKISKSLKQVLRSKKFRATKNKAFAEVISACANIERKDQDGTWLNQDLQNAFIELHRLGWAQSIEIWEGDKLVGGLYGIKINKVFVGESMFSSVSNASKVAMFYLCKLMNFKLIDCQVPNEHLMSLGAEMIDRKEYLGFLNEKIKAPIAAVEKEIN